MTPNYKESYIHKINSNVEKIAPDIRIIYIESDHPDILGTILNRETGSSELRSWLNINIYDSFTKAKHAHAGRPLAAVYQSHGNCGTLRNSQYYKEQQNITPANREEPEELSMTLDKIGKSKPIHFYTPNHEHLHFQISLAENQPQAVPPDKIIDLKKLPINTYLLGKNLLHFQINPIDYNSNGPISDDSCRFFYLTNADAIDQNTLAAMMRAFLESQDTYPNAKLLLTGTTRSIPSALAGQVLLIRLGVPSLDDIKQKLHTKLHEEYDAKLPFTDSQIDEFTSVLTGLTYLQLENVFADIGKGFLVKTLKKGKDKLSQIAGNEKKRESEKDGVIIFDKVEENPGIVGIGGFVRWLNENYDDLIDPKSAEEFGLTPPRGVILAGVPGTGKTQLAKQLTYQWWKSDKNASTIDFKIENLSSDKFGQSEGKMAYFLARISEQEPAVLLIDEVEKTFYKAKENRQAMHEVRQQQMGMLLKWLQEHTENIFTFMTSNDIDILPPELIRSGRISERFFLFLPNLTELICILYSQLKKRAHKGIFESAFSKEIVSVCEKIETYCSKYGRKASEDEELDQDLNQAIRNSSLCMFLIRLTEYAINPQQEEVRSKELSKADTLWETWFSDSSINMLTPFLTGADMGELLNLAISWLRRNKPDGKGKGKWTSADFISAMLECCREFQPYGQTNLDKLVDLYLSCDYKDASAHPLLPRLQFNKQDGRFVRDTDNIYILNTNPDNLYDKYLQQVLMREIEKRTAEEKQKKDREERRDRIEQAQEKHMEFQKEQINRQRRQWMEDDADKPARKEAERVSREIQRIQLKKLQ